MKQLIIALGRQVGSGGHRIGGILAQRFDLPLYDRNLLAEIAAQRQLDPEALRQYEESPKSRFLTRTIRGLNNSAQAGLAELQFRFLEEKAAEGEAFLIMGRCAEYILRDHPGLISIFISRDLKDRVAVIRHAYGLSEAEALDFIRKGDKRRAAYHSEHCPTVWGHSESYDLTINTSRLGLEGTADFLEEYIHRRIADDPTRTLQL